MNTVETILPETSFHTAYLSGENYYVRQRKKGIQKLKNGTLKTLNGSGTFQTYGMFGIIPFKDKELIITQEIGLWEIKNEQVFPVQKNVFNDKSKEIYQNLNNLMLHGITQLNNGNLLTYSILTGVTEINPNGEIVRNFNKDSGLKTNGVNHAYQTKSGELWLALTNGITKVNYNDPISYFGESKGVFGAIKSIQHSSSQDFIGTTEGLYMRFHSDKKFHKSNLPNIAINDIKLYNDYLFVATSAGLVMYDPFMESYDLKSNFPSSVLLIDEKNNSLILAGNRGVEILDLQSFAKKESFEKKFEDILSIEKSNNPVNADIAYWIGTMKGAHRLSYFDGFGFFDYFGEEAGFFNGISKPMYLHDKLVFGSGEGFLRFVDEKEMAKAANIPVDEAQGYFDFFNFKNGVIPQNQYVSAVASYKNKVWLGGANEVIEINDMTLEMHGKRPFSRRINGIVNTMSVHDSTLYIGTTDGLYTYQINNSKSYNEPFRSIINGIIINKSDTLLNGQLFTGIKNEFEYKFNDLEFNFTSTFNAAFNDVLFRYQLLGKDSTWSTWTADRKLIETNLEEGSYTLSIQAKNIYGTTSSTETFNFTILPPWYRTWWAYILFALGALLIIIAAVKISAYRLKEKNRELEGIVTERTKEIAHQRDEILEQKTEIEDSINYAVRIQEAMLPFQEEIFKSFPEHFVLFKPKDVVSGDFYWHTQKDHFHILVCADCTGHGVPGAFMSMVSSDKLSHAVAEYGIYMPDELLAFTNQGIKTALKQDETSENATRDGMDVAVITYDSQLNKLYYSGANRSLMILEDAEVSEIKATKVAVGGFTPMDQKFDLHEIDIKPSQTYYMTTDGYADQFGGVKGKKLKIKALKQTIIDNGHRPMIEQKEVLDQVIVDWMDGYEQVDDICIIGVRFK
jgi:serine phosphatase RsbU (regulator of sigma subunit)